MFEDSLEEERSFEEGKPEINGQKGTTGGPLDDNLSYKLDQHRCIPSKNCFPYPKPQEPIQLARGAQPSARDHAMGVLQFTSGLGSG